MPSSLDQKCAIVISESLPTGLAVNAASVLAVSLGANVEGIVGDDVKDSDGVTHSGVIFIPLPVLRHSTEGIAALLQSAAADDELFVYTFSSLAQSCKTYDEYIERMGATPTRDVEVVGVTLYGPKKKMNKLVGSLPLLR
jgi:hypothetical protein